MQERAGHLNPSVCTQEEVEDSLTAADQRPALALLLEKRGHTERAVRQWMVVADQGGEERSIEEVSRLLPAVTDTPQLLEHLKWVRFLPPSSYSLVLFLRQS